MKTTAYARAPDIAGRTSRVTLDCIQNARRNASLHANGLEACRHPWVGIPLGSGIPQRIGECE
jgi:hypothetical protein